MIGAGVVGLSAARTLASEGLDVLVVERERVGAEASSAAAGILGAQVETGKESPLLGLALAAREYHRDLSSAVEEETGIDVDYSHRGLLTLAFTEEREAELLAQAKTQLSRGMCVDVLGPEEIALAEPNLNRNVRRALFFRDDHRVDNVKLTRALAASAAARGARLLTGRPVTGLLVDKERIGGIRAGNESFRAPLVLNASGAWAGLVPGDPSPPPVEPVRGQIVAFEVSPPLLRHVVYSGHGYLVPRSDGQILAGSTSERAGFDKSVTASGLRQVLDTALQIAPVLADVRVKDSWAGLRPWTPDELPVIGEGALRGLFQASGLYRNGILLGPLVGDLVASLMLGREPTIDLTSFSPGRFFPARSRAPRG